MRFYNGIFEIWIKSDGRAWEGEKEREREKPRNRQTRFVIIIYISDGFLCWIMTCYRTPLFIFIKFGGTLNNWNEKKNDEPAQMKAGDVFSLNFLFSLPYQQYQPNGIPNAICSQWAAEYFCLQCEYNGGDEKVRSIFYVVLWMIKHQPT